MLNHYVPVQYLKGFTEPTTGTLRVYSKDNSPPFITSPRHVCGQNDYYSDETETYLTEVIERNGNRVLAKIRKGEPITEADKRALSEYIAALVKRGPWSENRFQEQAPQMLDNIGKGVRKALVHAKERNSLSDQKYNDLISELDVVIPKLKADPPRSSWEAGFSPEMTPHVIEVLNSMTWIFFVSGSEPVFLSSDNPVFLPNIGLEKKKSEFSFPISSKVALWGSWRTDLRNGYLRANKETITEFNRRTGAMFFRHLFAGFEKKWICRIATNKFTLRRLEVPKWSNKAITESYRFTSNC